MNKDYERDFNQKIDEILTKLYHDSDNQYATEKTATVSVDYKYIQFLEDWDLVSSRKTVHFGYALKLHKNGYEVFEKYGSWIKYKKKVIDKKHKVENARNLAQRFWWIPIIISLFALLTAIFSLLK